MDPRRVPRAVSDPKVRHVGFFAPAGRPDPIAPSPTLSDIPLAGNSLSPVMIPPPRHQSTEHSRNAPFAPPESSIPVGSYNPSEFLSHTYDFKEWCESECIRLIGSKDTSILEYCLKISRSEAEILLTENLGSFDLNREFIDKFLSYKDLLPADVVEIAFKNQSDWKSSASGAGDVISNHVDVGRSDPNSAGAAIDGGTKTGKKKGKKGKKGVSD